MLLSVALRLLHCNEMTSLEDLTLAYHTLETAYDQQQQQQEQKQNQKNKKKNQSIPKEDQRIIQRVLKLIQSILSSTTSTPHPSSSSSSSSSPSPSSSNETTIFIPHYQIGEYVWCQVGGWGYWPGKIKEQINEHYVIEFLNNEHEYIPYHQTTNSLRSFLHHFHTFTTVSTCRLDGFEAAVAVALESLVKKKLVSTNVITEILKKSSSERWSSRMKRIHEAIQVELPSFPLSTSSPLTSFLFLLFMPSS
jgi:hypothetical protein